MILAHLGGPAGASFALTMGLGLLVVAGLRRLGPASGTGRQWSRRLGWAGAAFAAVGAAGTWIHASGGP